MTSRRPARSCRAVRVRRAALILPLMLALPHALPAETPAPAPERIRAAVERSLPLIESSSAEARRQRECFTCHHQALPVLTLTEARLRGFAVDESNLRQQLDHTLAHLERGRESYREGRGQGGKADMAGWALWTLEVGGRAPDETTADVAGFLLTWNDDRDHWRAASQRPPTEASDFTTTYVALRGLSAYGTPDQQERIDARREKARQWLLATEAPETEDRVFRLRALHYVGADEETVRAAARELASSQREDGGWAQTDDMESDPYATGTALAALHEAGGVAVTEDAYRKGIAYLLDTQLDDGSWRVHSRSKPFQTYFESGFPHGKDQFISISASCWATVALLLTIEPDERPAAPTS